MNGPYAIIFTGGHYDDHPDASQFYQSLIDSSSFFICADSGADHASELKRTPLFIVGDMDSVSQETIKHFKNVKQIQFRCDKDYTDTEIAISKCIDEGYKNIVLCGAIGTRFDHSLSNVLSLIRLKNEGVEAKIINYYEEIFVAKPYTEIEGKQGWTISFLPLTSSVTNVTISGCQYSLSSSNLQFGYSLTVSNVITSPKAVFTFDEGEVIVVITRPNGVA
ncbi:thiamine pyrophosphokinase, putative [Entamoeba dispar SAW760]|uniref:Thiamine pyrophosphokinase, putative n=1 Tax=Entamoeba dispar (strain ATCC PRA-260 / SAW760) TaxID=370354 RepID=B0EL02_ENTDS|nr:thiamine pyrophosphokinase, putative [Entamoeba dispar SAW760]EDR24764.1 thiamine pyrophosphokinase, putative [Entamoeba dispar SAW760]|eukprot:EDR24764.1 thiamine pyrophosphokinase, putative [Entamoeba dispar SAW760]